VADWLRIVRFRGITDRISSSEPRGSASAETCPSKKFSLLTVTPTLLLRKLQALFLQVANRPGGCVEVQGPSVDLNGHILVTSCILPEAFWSDLSLLVQVRRWLPWKLEGTKAKLPRHKSCNPSPHAWAQPSLVNQCPPCLDSSLSSIPWALSRPRISSTTTTAAIPTLPSSFPYSRPSPHSLVAVGESLRFLYTLLLLYRALLQSLESAGRLGRNPVLYFNCLP
jgi:hypothetical protein